jgi:hypothetical protein
MKSLVFVFCFLLVSCGSNSGKRSLKDANKPAPIDQKKETTQKDDPSPVPGITPAADIQHPNLPRIFNAGDRLRLKTFSKPKTVTNFNVTLEWTSASTQQTQNIVLEISSTTSTICIGNFGNTPVNALFDTTNKTVTVLHEGSKAEDALFSRLSTNDASGYIFANK